MSHEPLQNRSTRALCEAVKVLEKSIGELQDILIEGSHEKITDEFIKLRDELVVIIGYRTVDNHKKGEKV